MGTWNAAGAEELLVMWEIIQEVRTFKKDVVKKWEFND